MNTPIAASTPPLGRRRRWPLIVGLILLVPIVLIASVPWLLNTRAGNRVLASRVKQAFAPGELAFDTIHFSWFASTRLTKVTLGDPHGKEVVAAPSATLSPSLWGLLTRPDRLGSLTLDSASFEVERKADGSIDIAEALQGVVRSSSPLRDLAIHAEGASVRLKLPHLHTPIHPDRMDLLIRIRPAPASVDWRLDLGKGADQSLRITGEFDRWRSRPTSVAKPDLSLNITSVHWPVDLTVQGFDVTGQLDGQFAIDRVSALWKSTGLAEVKETKVKGQALKGDSLDLSTLTADWSVSEVEGGWSVDRFDLQSPLGSLNAVFPQPPDPSRPAKIVGELQLASIARQLPHALRLREGLMVESGTAKLAVVSRSGTGRSEWSVDARLADLAARQGDRKLTLRDPAALSALVVRRESLISVDRLDLKTGFADLSVHGDLDRGIDLTGSLDLAALRSQLADWLELGAIDLAGHGTLSANYRRSGPTYTSETRMQVSGLRLLGLSSTPIQMERASFSGGAEGRNDSLGFPLSITKAKLGLEAGDLFADAEWRPEAEGSSVEIKARGPVRVSDRQGRVEASLTGHWSGLRRLLDIEEVSLGLRPEQDDPKLAALAWSAKGRLDLDAGSLQLLPTRSNDLATPITLASEGLNVAGFGQSANSLRIDAGWIGDVSALDRLIAGWTGRLPRDLTGRWHATISTNPVKEGLSTAVRLDVANLSWPSKAERHQAEAPLTFSARSLYRTDPDRLDLSELTLVTPLGTLQAEGGIDGLNGPALVDIKGTITPDWVGLTNLLADRFEPGAKLSGSSSPFRIKGPLVASNDSAFEADFRVELSGANLFGMSLAATPIAVHLRDRTLAIDPIHTVLNDGTLHLEPRLDLEGKEGAALILDKGSRLDNAKINDQVSRRVLSYVAPILDQATRASGRVSMTIDRAEFPIASDARRRLNLTGAVVFQDVEFAPGPLTRQMIGLISQKEPGILHLDEPVHLSIADGRVHQSGLAIPVGKLTRLEVEGWVDFDKNIDLVASLPVTPAMVGNNPVLGSIVSGTKFQVPITGTLASPKFDKEAFNIGIKGLGKSLLTRSAGVGALELLNQLTKPRVPDPDAPPPAPRLTPDERKALRMERKNDRRRARGLAPVPIPDGP